MKDESATDNGSGRIQDFTDLRVWQAAMTLAEEVYRLSDSFPARETYGLTAQIRRAVVSVPSNIAEGFARGHLKEYVQHLAMARGSLAEVAKTAAFLLSDDSGYITGQNIRVDGGITRST